LTPLTVVHARQDNAGPGAARNHGAQLARGRLVLFIDDDIVATPTLVEQHLRAHGDSTFSVVIGPMSNAPGFKYSPWVAWEQAKLYKQYRAMHDGVYAASFRQFYTGNASLPRELFFRAGGFDTTFRRAEDIELSYRLDQLGATFVFDETAIAYHFAERSFASWIAAADAYGRNDVTFARDHDQHWLLPAMATEFKERSVFTRVLVRACLTRPRLGTVAARSLRAIGVAPWMIPRVSSLALSGLYGLTYYRSAGTEYGDTAEFRAMLCAR
ncbi:MAG TPA: glycosyltransferase, partial [Ilumatobacteraceae bacterium]|nr:glycosyltransferase [Ilumatobacteraceae bacterium]